MADKYKRGFYIQEDFWLAVEDCTAKQQNEVMGSLTRLFFRGEDSAASLRGVSKSVYIALRDRVATSRAKSGNRGGGFGDQTGDRKRLQAGDQTGDQKGDQTGHQNSDLLAKRESKSEISTCEIPKRDSLPNLDAPTDRAFFVGRALEIFTEVTGRPCLIPSGEVAFMLTRIFDAGYTADDVRLVCESKFAEWGHDTKCQKWLRPQTLFGDRFEGYLAAAKADPAREVDDAAAQFADAF